MEWNIPLSDKGFPFSLIKETVYWLTEVTANWPAVHIQRMTRTDTGLDTHHNDVSL